jgi:hypothetical protein
VSRGRKAHSDPPVQRFISLPTTLAAKVDLLLMDPVMNKPKYGSWSDLIQVLLRRWVEDQINPSPPPS